MAPPSPLEAKINHNWLACSDSLFDLGEVRLSNPQPGLVEAVPWGSDCFNGWLGGEPPGAERGGGHLPGPQLLREERAPGALRSAGLRGAGGAVLRSLRERGPAQWHPLVSLFFFFFFFFGGEGVPSESTKMFLVWGRGGVSLYNQPTRKGRPFFSPAALLR